MRLLEPWVDRIGPAARRVDPGTPKQKRYMLPRSVRLFRNAKVDRILLDILQNVSFMADRKGIFIAVRV